ncbi:RES family NAD+ phosphorylase [Photorhabdus heterorhabditis]|uniref:RES family NAD+ phosphorylase n=1 Tax=Photorhabdus heterorhabditis TaxID=880156 RepID=UPI001BD2F31A|nr:RES family NAD+ phosphorylase [Photorhabdus heterorhabditis]MBS9444271.1 RES domain-containing protein [Photorhabdus heterorhabditis]
MTKQIMHPGEVAEICRQIKNSNDRDFIYSGFRQLLSQLPMGFHDVTATTLWRARKTDESHPEGFNQVTDIIYPPAQYARTGRLNTEGMSILYASISNHGCLAEIGAQPGDKVHVSAFTLKAEQRLHCGFLGDIVRAHKWSNEDFPLVEKTLAPYLEVQKTSIFLIDSFLAETLADSRAKENSYLHTTVLADVIRNGRNALDAIVYPGVESSGAKNYAIYYDTMLKSNIADMYLLEITNKYPYGLYEWRLLKRLKRYDNGRIIWKEPSCANI